MNVPPGGVVDMGSYRLVNPGGRIGSKFARGEAYERQLLSEIASLGLSGTAFDIGAYVGGHSLFLAAECGFVVHAWEPHPVSIAAMLGNLALNPDLDITLHQWAASDAKGTAHLTRGMAITDALRSDSGSLSPGGSIETDLIDDRLQVDDLAVVKIDVEGHEARALAGMVGHLRACQPVVYAEAHSTESSDAVGAVLRPLGYEVDLRIQMGSLMERWRTP